jgi:hypothetical protein
MKNTLVVVTDLGGFKAYRLDDNQLNSSPRLELLAEFNNPQAHTRLIETVTDLSGRFPRRTGTSRATRMMSDGERHNLQLEQRKRGVRRMATELNVLMRSGDIEQCWLAASREMNRQLLDELDPQARAKIGMNIPADLMKVSKSDLLAHFHA